MAKKQIPLGADPKPKRDKTGKPVPPKEVIDRYHELMAQRDDDNPTATPALSKNPAVAAILDEFLEWTYRHKAARTYAWYRENIQRFLDGLPKGLTLRRPEALPPDQGDGALPALVEQHEARLHRGGEAGVQLGRG